MPQARIGRALDENNTKGMRLFGADVSTSTEPQAAAALVTMDRHKETIESRFQVPVRTNV